MKRTQRVPASGRILALAAAAGLLAGCSYLHRTFSQTVDPGTASRIHDNLPVGTGIDAAEAWLSAQGYNCDTRTGDYIDETGHARSADRYLSCVERPGRIGFTCENRDQVIVVPKGGVVDEVNVVRGPDCSKP